VVVVTLATVPAYDRTRSVDCDGRAVVVGAGVAGLLAARVLADAFDAVTVLERDAVPDGPAPRRGVPQSHHIHVLLEAGRAVIDALLPGYRRAFLGAGGLEIDGARDVRFYTEGGFLADGPRPMPQFAATRPLYEAVLRRSVAALDGVRVRPGRRVIDYRTDDAGATIDGVVVEEGGVESDLDAALVVDATGRTSRTPAWLDRHGYAPPPVDEVTIDLGYSTALVERPPDDPRAVVVTPSPSCPRTAAVLPVEDDRWVVTVGGVHGDHPPTDPDGLAAFAAGLPIPHVERLLDERARTADVVGYRFPSNRRHRYERLDRLPGGLVVVGDAVASFNPIYAQGMSVAALEALVLHRALADGCDDLGPRFFRESASVVDVAWSMAVGADHRFPATTGPRPRGVGLVTRYIARLSRAAQTDGDLREALFRVFSMERPPIGLLHPRVAWRVIRPRP
jgi:2-polyprenyl-6-methoxyphenol hydroxylase-like FAD-dependent oxidoreductase